MNWLISLGKVTLMSIIAHVRQVYTIPIATGIPSHTILYHNNRSYHYHITIADHTILFQTNTHTNTHTIPLTAYHTLPYHPIPYCNSRHTIPYLAKTINIPYHNNRYTIPYHTGTKEHTTHTSTNKYHTRNPDKPHHTPNKPIPIPTPEISRSSWYHGVRESHLTVPLERAGGIQASESDSVHPARF